MNRKLIMGVFFALSLATIIAVAAIAPAIVIAKPNSDGTLYQYISYGGQVTVQLPQGNPPHPTTLIIGVFHNKHGDYPLDAESDVIAAYIWVEQLNRFLPAIAIGNNDNPEHQDFIKQLYMNTPLWNPALGMENLVWVDKDQLVLQKNGDVLLANLTEGMHVSLDFTEHPLPPMAALGDLSFDLPAIAMEVRGIDSPYKEESSGTLPSGWSVESSYLRKPAWVRLWIQDWTGGTGDPFKFAGVLGVYGKSTHIPPSV